MPSLISRFKRQPRGLSYERIYGAASIGWVAGLVRRGRMSPAHATVSWRPEGGSDVVMQKNQCRDPENGPLNPSWRSLRRTHAAYTASSGSSASPPLRLSPANTGMAWPSLRPSSNQSSSVDCSSR